MSRPGIEPGPPAWEASTLEKSHLDSLSAGYLEPLLGPHLLTTFGPLQYLQKVISRKNCVLKVRGIDLRIQICTKMIHSFAPTVTDLWLYGVEEVSPSREHLDCAVQGFRTHYSPILHHRHRNRSKERKPTKFLNIIFKGKIISLSLTRSGYAHINCRVAQLGCSDAQLLVQWPTVRQAQGSDPQEGSAIERQG